MGTAGILLADFFGGWHFFDSTKVRKASVGARTRALELFLHAPFSIDKGQLLITDPSRAGVETLRVKVRVEFILGVVRVGGGYIEFTRTEPVFCDSE